MGRPGLVLMYHSITEGVSDPNNICVSPERFADQLDWLRKHNYHGVSTRELLAAEARGKADRLVGLTFDDGYEDFQDTALPILAGFGFTATVFVIANRMGGTNDWDSEPRLRLMDADAVREVAQQGIEIGSHSANHWRLREVGEDQLKRELVDSRATLEAIDGVQVDGFCYPYGDADARVARATRDAGYRYACATKPGDRDNAWLIPRKYVGDNYGPMRMRASLLVAKR